MTADRNNQKSGDKVPYLVDIDDVIKSAKKKVDDIGQDK